jgi:DNA modification methylase
MVLRERQREVAVPCRSGGGMTARVLVGDCLDVLPTLAIGCADAIVTDPPYGLAFMGKAWDHGVPGAAYWSAALHVVKPGAYLLAFGGTRTFHRLACAIEDAGW